jgi:hypothetical protein
MLAPQTCYCETATFRFLSQDVILLPEHHRERVGISHLLGNRAGFLGAPSPVFEVIEVLVRRSRDCRQRLIGRSIAKQDTERAASETHLGFPHVCGCGGYLDTEERSPGG